VPPRERKTKSDTGRNGVAQSTVTALETTNGAKLLERVASGMTVTEAATTLGLSRQQGSKLFNNELRRVTDTNNELRQEILAQELETLRLLHRAFMAGALRGDYQSAKIVLGVLDRRAKYLGLDAAIKIEVSNDRINEAVDGIVALLEAANGDELPTLLEAETEAG
jgi:DNA-binding transcriptional LysR family regulator